MHLHEYAQLDATALSHLVKTREISSAELLELSLKAIAQVNPTLNFVSHDLAAHARRTLRDGIADGPFEGVPFLLKDLGAQLAGTPYNAGSRLMEGNVSVKDTNLMTRFKAAGLLTVAKSTTPEFGAQINTEPLITGITRNPWNLDHTPGGSSGGSAAAVAAGVVPLAHANDGLGSIRIPASNCGIFGLKPTRQRTPAGPDAAEISGGRGVEFVVSRSVRDSARLLDCVHGADIGAPHWAPPPSEPYGAAIGKAPRRLRIALMDTTFTGASVAQECRDAARSAALLCHELGHTLSEAAPRIDWEAYLWAVRLAGSASMGAGLQATARAMGREASEDMLEPLTWLCFQEGLTATIPDYFRALGIYAQLQRTMGQFFVDYDILITPVLSKPPAPIGWLGSTPDDVDAYWERFGGDAYSPFAGVFNVTGHPAASLPLHWTEDGLPIGVQLVGGFGEEGLLLQLAAQIEEARPWAQRVPPVHVSHRSGG